MGITFNAEEVLKMAERTEANGAAFYRRAAELRPASERETADKLRALAAMEEEHEQTFAAMRAELPERMREDTAADPYMEAGMYLGNMADKHGGEGSPSAAEALTGEESVEQVLRTAIGLEEKSIVFYLGLKDMVPAKLGRDRIDAIIDEEKGHIVVLAGELKKAVAGS